MTRWRLAAAVCAGLGLITAQAAIAGHTPAVSRVGDRVGGRAERTHGYVGWEALTIGLSGTTVVVGTVVAGIAISCFNDDGDS